MLSEEKKINTIIVLTIEPITKDVKTLNKQTTQRTHESNPD